MGHFEELKREYEELMRQCDKCRNPSMCPTCRIAKRLIEISEQLDNKPQKRWRMQNGEWVEITDERT